VLTKAYDRITFATMIERYDQIGTNCGLTAGSSHAGIAASAPEDHGDGTTASPAPAHLPEFGAKHDIRHMRGNDGNAQARLQRNAEQQLRALAEMCPHR